MNSYKHQYVYLKFKIFLSIFMIFNYFDFGTGTNVECRDTRLITVRKGQTRTHIVNSAKLQILMSQILAN